MINTDSDVFITINGEELPIETTSRFARRGFIFGVWRYPGNFFSSSAEFSVKTGKEYGGWRYIYNKKYPTLQEIGLVD